MADPDGPLYLWLNCLLRYFTTGFPACKEPVLAWNSRVASLVVDVDYIWPRLWGEALTRVGALVLMAGEGVRDRSPPPRLLSCVDDAWVAVWL